MTPQYVGILDRSGKSFGVREPDLPGCHGAGPTPEAAIADTMSAAREWLVQRETGWSGLGHQKSVTVK